MHGLAEIVELFIYVVLSIPPAYILLLMTMREKGFWKRGIGYLLIAVLPLILFSYHDYSKQNSEEHKYLGSYSLTHYPNCPSCVLKLNKNNSYVITDSGLVVHEGQWEYESGQDYSFVVVGDKGQLGLNHLKYDEFRWGE
jgi:hypothetical protein